MRSSKVEGRKERRKEGTKEGRKEGRREKGEGRGKRGGRRKKGGCGRDFDLVLSPSSSLSSLSLSFLDTYRGDGLWKSVLRMGSPPPFRHSHYHRDQQMLPPDIEMHR